MNLFLPPLLADIGDVIKLLVFVAAGIFWVIQHLMSEKGKVDVAPKPRPNVDAPPQQPVEEEIADFLRQAARRAESTRPAEAARPPQVQTPPARRPQKQQAKQAKPPKPNRQRELKERHSVEEHVRTQLDTSEFAVRTDRLGDAVESAGTQLEARLQRKFANQVGSLSQSAGESGTAPATTVSTATQLAGPMPAAAVMMAMLRDPASIRQAFIFHEILTPPAERW